MARILLQYTFLYGAVAKSLDICQEVYGKDVVTHTSFKHGEHVCCKRITCYPGYEAVICNPDDPFSTRCQPCPEDTFQSEFTESPEMKYCDVKQSCHAGMKILNDDSKITDRQCICDLEQGFCKPFRNRSTFCQRKNCPPGMQLNIDCNCTKCLEGFFKEDNGSLPCKSWRNCESTLIEGSAVSDKVCLVPAAGGTDGADITVSTDDTEEQKKKWIILVVCFVCFAGIVSAAAVFYVCVVHHRGKNFCQTYCKWVCKPDEGTEDEHREQVSSYGESTPPSSLSQSPGQLKTKNKEKIALINVDLQTEDEPNNSSDEMSVMVKNLNSCRTSLIEKLVIDEIFLSLLLVKSSITYSMKERIQSKSTSSEKVDQLLDFLCQRPSSAYKTFLYALVYTSQEHLARKVDPELYREYKMLCDLDENITPEEIVLNIS